MFIRRACPNTFGNVVCFYTSTGDNAMVTISHWTLHVYNMFIY